LEHETNDQTVLKENVGRNILCKQIFLIVKHLFLGRWGEVSMKIESYKELTERQNSIRRQLKYTFNMIWFLNVVFIDVLGAIDV